VFIEENKLTKENKQIRVLSKFRSLLVYSPESLAVSVCYLTHSKRMVFEYTNPHQTVVKNRVHLKLQHFLVLNFKSLRVFMLT